MLVVVVIQAAPVVAHLECVYLVNYCMHRDLLSGGRNCDGGVTDN